MDYMISDIEGVKIIALKKNIDERGFLTETYRIDTLPQGVQPAMGYVSFTKSGASRGPHEHVHQTDVFAFLGPGNFELQLWDNRKESITYNNKMILFVGEDNPATIIVPPCVVHGYINTSEIDGMMLNYPDRLFKGTGKKEEVDEIRHEDREDEFYLDFIK